MTEGVLRIVGEISRILKGKADAWMVGGCVRDLMLGRDPVDVDLVISGPEDLVPLLASQLKATLVELSRPFGMYRLVLPGGNGNFCVDIEILKEGDITANLGRRDFTVDAMAIPLHERGIQIREVIDPWGGRSDIKAGVIRAVSPRVFEDDPVRALRAYRLAGYLGFTVHPETLCYLRTMKRGLDTVAGERVWREFRAILALRQASGILRKMENEACLLRSMIPELGHVRTVIRRNGQVLDLCNHAILALEVLEEVLEPVAQGRFGRVGELLAAAVSGLTKDWKPALKLGVLLCDLPQPLPAVMEEEGPGPSGQEKTGLDIARAVIERWNLAVWERRIVESVVDGYMRPYYLFLNNGESACAKRRFVNKYGDRAAFILVSSLAYVTAVKMARDDVEQQPYEEFVCDFLHFLITEGNRWYRLPRYIDGEKVMMILGIGPSPEVGKVLKVVAEKEIEGEIESEEEAEAFVRSSCGIDVCG